MLRKKNIQSKSSSTTLNDGLSGNTPGVQSRRVITVFINKDQKDENRRDLDDFQRPEGYQPFTPRQIGVPKLGDKRSKDQNFEVFSLPKQPSPKNVSSRRIRWFFRRRKIN
jgi:hypothetical protein